MQEKENPTDNAVAYRWGLTHYGAKRSLFKEKLPYQHSAFLQPIIFLYLGDIFDPTALFHQKQSKGGF